jgi:hypothetical protein
MVEGTFDQARFNCPLGLVLREDEDSLFVADFNSGGVRQVQLDNDYVAPVGILDWPRWDAPGTLRGRPLQLDIATVGGHEIMRITAVDPDESGVLLEWDIDGGDTTSSLSTAGTLGAIAYDPGYTTATVKMHVGEAETGWGTLALSGPDRGQITEPPVLPDPPFCDPPTNSVPVQVMQVRDTAYSGDSGVARIGSVVVAFRWLPAGTGVVAFDPWNETAFPSPYTTCAAPTDPASIEVACTGAIATPRPPWNATRGPDDPRTGLPTVIGAPWRSPNGILLRTVLDTDGAAMQVDYDLVTGFADIPAVGVAYSPKRKTYYFTTADVWGNPGTQVPPNVILALEWVPEPSFYFGGSGRMPIRSVTAP